jgi:hypothetical protein
MQTQPTQTVEVRVPKEGDPGSRTWDELPWKDDPWAQAFVEAHPEGATVPEIAAAMGIVESTVYKLLRSGARKVVWRGKADRC